jgi:hypothetical protein
MAILGNSPSVALITQQITPPKQEKIESDYVKLFIFSTLANVDINLIKHLIKLI